MTNHRLINVILNSKPGELLIKSPYIDSCHGRVSIESGDGAVVVEQVLVHPEGEGGRRRKVECARHQVVGHFLKTDKEKRRHPE